MYHEDVKCPITGKNCLKHKSFDSGKGLVCEDCFQKSPTPIMSVAEIKCASCGMTLSSLIKGSRFGCAVCYESFQDAAHIIEAVQLGSLRHIGRVPESFLKEKSKSISVEEIKEEIKMRMDSAASKGDYVVAAKMKSKIKDLEIIAKKNGQAKNSQLAHFVLSFWKEISEGFY